MFIYVYKEGVITSQVALTTEVWSRYILNTEY